MKGCMKWFMHKVTSNFATQEEQWLSLQGAISKESSVKSQYGLNSKVTLIKLFKVFSK